MTEFSTLAIVVLGCLVAAFGIALVVLALIARRQNAFLRRVTELASKQPIDWEAYRRIRARVECERRELARRGGRRNFSRRQSGM